MVAESVHSMHGMWISWSETMNRKWPNNSMSKWLCESMIFVYVYMKSVCRQLYLYIHVYFIQAPETGCPCKAVAQPLLCSVHIQLSEPPVSDLGNAHRMEIWRCMTSTFPMKERSHYISYFQQHATISGTGTSWWINQKGIWINTCIHLSDADQQYNIGRCVHGNRQWHTSRSIWFHLCYSMQCHEWDCPYTCTQTTGLYMYFYSFSSQLVPVWRWSVIMWDLFAVPTECIQEEDESSNQWQLETVDGEV